MRHSLLFALLFLGAGLLTFSGCIEDRCSAFGVFVKMDPVYITDAQLAEPIQLQESRALENPGKIYVYGQYILINERYAGLHIIDNSNPEEPVNTGFLNIPGNVDMAVRNNVLYADNVNDLLAIDVSDMSNPVVAGRVEGVFEDSRFYPYVDGQGYIIDYVTTSVSEVVSCDDPRFSNDWWFDSNNNFFVAEDIAEASFSNASNNSGGTGTGGSMARFTISQDFLYTVGDASLNVFNISQANQPVQTSTVDLGWGIETIYPYQDKLFVGARTGMFLFDNSQPSNPILMSSYSHWNSCDPVVVEDNIAYVTLRGGTPCDGFVNQLEIIDVEDITAPRLISTWPMDGPYGLAIRDKVLYLCDGDSGLKVFDVTNPISIDLDSHITGLDTYDAISLSNEHLLVVGSNGLYQFDVSDSESPRIVSIIPVQ